MSHSHFISSRPSDGDVNRAVPCIRVYPLGTLKNHRNSKKVDFLCILPLSLGRPNITIAVEWPLNTIQFINKWIELSAVYCPINTPWCHFGTIQDASLCTFNNWTGIWVEPPSFHKAKWIAFSHEMFSTPIGLIPQPLGVGTPLLKWVIYCLSFQLCRKCYCFTTPVLLFFVRPLRVSLLNLLKSCIKFKISFHM